ncbi:hypothetical protein COCON_G00204350 [Conger conger]|uniref:Uncharacterized protein n=1 Tax=Conger conger TaxID=82655 RepID=A0A9Q1HPS5_CONCO|nr:hypothetical protein COCON_G00204350 [Conger conger]
MNGFTTFYAGGVLFRRLRSQGFFPCPNAHVPRSFLDFPDSPVTGVNSCRLPRVREFRTFCQGHRTAPI